MAGIPSDLLNSLRKTLADCEPFETNRSLRALFSDARLIPWRYSLPQADGILERVDSVVSYLHDKKHRDGSNALVSLLLVLADSIDPGDDRHEQLKTLAARLVQAPGQAALSPVATGTPQGQVPASPAPDAARSGAPASGSEPAAPTETTAGKRDFFISYNRHDKDWAEWIAWQLENEGYTTFIQAWDFREGGNFVARMQEAAEKSKRTIAVLSETYLTSKFARSEWNAAFAQDPSGEEGLLLPVRVRECNPQGLLSQIVYIDLLGLSAEEAKQRLLDGIKQGRAKPLVPPNFPGAVTRAEPPLPANS